MHYGMFEEYLQDIDRWTKKHNIIKRREKIIRKEDLKSIQWAFIFCSDTCQEYYIDKARTV